jgi:hypothetical protein
MIPRVSAICGIEWRSAHCTLLLTISVLSAQPSLQAGLAKDMTGTASNFRDLNRLMGRLVICLMADTALIVLRCDLCGCCVVSKEEPLVFRCLHSKGLRSRFREDEFVLFVFITVIRIDFGVDIWRW